MERETMERACERCGDVTIWFITPEAPNGDPLCINCQCDDIEAIIKQKFAEIEVQRHRTRATQ